MRFHRNAGAKGGAEWACLTPDQSRIFCYARVVLVKDVVFETKGADGWALGELLWLAMPVAHRGVLLPPEVAKAERPDALRRLPVHGWLPLWYRQGEGFSVHGSRVTRARRLLLGPGVALVRGPS